MDRAYWVNVGKGGTFRRSGDLHTLPEHVDALLRRLDERNVRRVVLHFHGGLISEAAGAAISEKLVDDYQAAGAHPIFVLWESGLLETVSRNLSSLHGTKLFRKLLEVVIKQAAKRLGVNPGGKGVGVMPSDEDIEHGQTIDDFESFEPTARGGAAALSEAQIDAQLGDIQAEIEAALSQEPDLLGAMQRAADDTVPPRPEVRPGGEDGSKGFIEVAMTLAGYLAKVVIAVVKRYIRRTEHGFYPTVVEEILRAVYVADLGQWVWGGMKDVAVDMWKPNDGLTGEDMHGGRYLLRGLSALQEKRPGLTVDLVGHSAGSIAAAHMLETAASAHPLKVRNVLLLAPAIRADEFVARMASPAVPRFDALRVFTMRDEHECDDQLVPGVYTRSLLYFISGVLEDSPDTPLLGLHRHHSGAAPYDRDPALSMARWIAEGGQRMVLSTTGDGADVPLGFRSGSRTHGGFDDDELTLASLRHIIAGGNA